MKYFPSLFYAVTLALGAGIPNAANADLTEIPSCTGWQLKCGHHAPDWAITFEADGTSIRMVDSNANLLPPQSVIKTTTATTANSSTFTLSNGVSARMTLLRHPTCSDGHLFDSAPFSIEILSSVPGFGGAVGSVSCCVLEPY